ncbi:MAG: argininosuccinate lyase [Betaproteobacteria bacterium]|nr:argininosuccinate lyase [Betaproteobacteria bacterium]
MRKQDHTQYRGFREPGIRMMEPLAESLNSHRSEPVKPKLYAYHLFDKAHLVMLVEEALIPREDGVAMLRALREMEAEGVDEARLRGGGGMHSGEPYLIRKLTEEVGGRIHLGRSSGDLGEVGKRIYMRDNLINLIELVTGLRDTLIAVAEANLDTVMPGYTHAQHAQPTTWGHMILSWVSVLERDTDRLLLNLTHVNRSPAGAAILTGSDFPINRHRVGELLGFDGIEKNTYDAILSHDNLFETLSALSILHMNLARWCDDLMLYNTSEFGMVRFPDRFCGTSSIMMQKVNAYAPQFIKGAAARTVGGLMTAFIVEKDPSSVPILDRAYSDQAIMESFDALMRDIGWINEFMPVLTLDKDLMRERSGEFWCQATEVAGALVRDKGIPWRSAHQIVGILVRYAEERHIRPLDVTTQLLDEASIEYMGEPAGLSARSLQVALDPVAAVHRRTLYGGPAPDEVRQRLPEYKSALARDRAQCLAARQHVASGLARLEAAIDAMLK